MVDFVLALAEFDGRRLWVDLGYASLFDFLHRELGMSAGAAFYRKTAVVLVQRHPEMVDALADGRLCITSVPEIAKVITDENAAEVLPRFFHRSKREAREVAAAIAPHAAPPRRDVITALGAGQARRVDCTAAPRGPTLGSDDAAPAHSSLPASDGSGIADALRTPEAVVVRGRADARRPPVADNVEPLTASLRRVHMTVSDRWVQKLEALRAALSHSHPAGRAEEITEYALDVALEHVARKKGPLAKNGRSDRPASGVRPRPPSRRREGTRTALASRAPDVGDDGASGAAESHAPANHPASRSRARRSHVPADVRRLVMARDEGRCQWKLHDGTVCGSNVRVQLDHIHPAALGGASTIENLRLLCERHNQLAARGSFGEGWMDQFTAPAADSS